jgi:hypothetical protein
LWRQKREPETEPEGLYSPPERGAQDPDPSQFNVRDTVEARGTAQSGAVAVADGIRRPLPGGFTVPDGTYGTVKGVDLDNIFVAFPIEVPRSPWRHSRADEGPDFQTGDRLKAVGDVDTAWGTIPHGHVVNVLDDLGDTLRVQLMLQFPKEDWWNRREPDLRRWGKEARHRKKKRRRIARQVWYLPDNSQVANNRPPGRPVVLKSSAMTISGNQRLANMEVDAINLGSQLVVLNMNAVEDEMPARKRWIQANRQADRNPGDDPARASLDVLGLPVSIEFFSGEERPHYGRTCPGHYGYFDDTRAVDGDSIDVMLGPNWKDKDPSVWVIEQLDPEGNETVHQYKTLIGWDDEDAAREAFLELWPERMLGEMESCNASEFRDAWLPELNEIPEVREGDDAR